MKVLIIGYGSIGKRHYGILQTLPFIQSIDIVTQQTLNNQITFTSLQEINNLHIYNYFIISSITSQHYKQLRYLCSHVSKKFILVEKPLFHKRENFIQTDNIIYTAYNLRFHPVLSRLKKILANEEIYYANILCGQYLPSWRPEQDYTRSYSADTKQGGGVLRDLSHELDYSRWLFGEILHNDYISTKISDLIIKSDDIFTALIQTDKKIIVNITMDYLSKVPLRRLVIHTQNKTIEADLIKNTLFSHDVNAKKTIYNIQKIEKDFTYKEMHKAILASNPNNICSYEEGIKVVNIIDSIECKDLLVEK